MPKYLIDVNLPYRFSLWRGEDFLHQRDIDDEWTDQQIWDHAREHSLTIVSKDADFSNYIINRDPPPRVIHIRIGNISMRDFFTLMTAVWSDVCELSDSHKLVNVFRDRIEGIE